MGKELSKSQMKELVSLKMKFHRRKITKKEFTKGLRNLGISWPEYKTIQKEQRHSRILIRRFQIRMYCHCYDLQYEMDSTNYVKIGYRGKWFVIDIVHLGYRNSQQRFDFSDTPFLIKQLLKEFNLFKLWLQHKKRRIQKKKAIGELSYLLSKKYITQYEFEQMKYQADAVL